ncbi:SfnB family sulfur acquisition oxidoreductase [Sinorhizobium arboris]|uniref:SfnB family sulfur acquisition oxidoreductase n=1 Tax=Sinorhizobium arboris TaxID=76745 RepID=UPI00040E40B4|nr:SfnB family sulfur acquisition oxidoreductase [Sinorhizobium arboris]
MGSISQFAGKSRPVPHRIESEEEALAVAREFAFRFAERASERDLERVLPHDELDQLAQSGLLAISIPSEYEGIDVSNVVLAEVTAILSEADSSIGQIPQGHFCALEALRQHATEEQKQFFFGRAMAGDRFGSALSQDGNKTVSDEGPRITADGAGYRIGGRKQYSTGVLFADWLAISALDAAGRITMSFVARATEGVRIIDDWDSFGQRVTGTGTVVLENVPVDLGSVVPHHRGFERPNTIGPISQIIHAGVDLGIARAAFRETLELARNTAPSPADKDLERASNDALTIAKVGEVAIRIEAATALVEHAGRKVDTAQVDATEEHAIEASLAVTAANALAAEAALEAANALFALAGTASAKVALNLDRFWRNARAHTLQDPVRWKHHLVGNYHLNGVRPRNGSL